GQMNGQVTGQMAMERIPTYCALCISRCGCVATVDDSRLVRVERDPDHPTGGAICIKAKTAPEFVHHRDRLTTPLVRTNPKGSGDPGFRAVGWDEALDLVADRLKSIAAVGGPEAVAFAVTTPSGTAIADSFGWIHRLVHAFGSPNLVFATENCNWHKDFTPMLTWGAGIGMPDYANTGVILLWGFNPTATWLAQVAPIRQAQRRGARLVVIDPRRQGLARSADLWLGLRPGTDGALALGLAHLLLERGGADEAFLRHHTDAPFLVRDDDGTLLTETDLSGPDGAAAPTVWDETSGAAVPCPVGIDADAVAAAALSGVRLVARGATTVSCRTVLDKLRQRCAGYPPDRVAEITGLSVADIEQLAVWLATTGPASFFTWTGTAQHSNATQTTRALDVLYALTGGLDAPGGNVWFNRPPVRDISGFEWVGKATRSRTLGLDERPLGPPRRGWITTRDLFRTIVTGEPYPVRALVSFGGNFALTKPRTQYAEEALRGLDFFVATELFLTPSCQQADVVLPVASAWERSGLQAGFMISQQAEEWLQLRPAVVPPRGESRSDTDIVFQLATRLGFADRFFGGDPEQGLRHELSPTGVSLETLRANPRGVRVNLASGIGRVRRDGFATPSGRVELFAAALGGIGEHRLPIYHAPAMSPEGRPGLAEFPLRLTCAKWPQFCHSQQRQQSSITRAMPHPLVQLHPQLAAARGIDNDDPVIVMTPHGRFAAHAELTTAVRLDVVCAQYGWWDPASPWEQSELSYNGAIDGAIIDAASGSNSLRSYLCEVARATHG
ncbi:MAG TPA: molybdopterin-dependent oxidoreductase, partial [Devosiaceae bacterium]|nr:molybdopterin-dependent oxidoreductase [Devosiaceae bacterium]